MNVSCKLKAQTAIFLAKRKRLTYNQEVLKVPCKLLQSMWDQIEEVFFVYRGIEQVRSITLSDY